MCSVEVRLVISGKTPEGGVLCLLLEPQLVIRMRIYPPIKACSSAALHRSCDVTNVGDESCCFDAPHSHDGKPGSRLLVGFSCKLNVKYSVVQALHQRRVYIYWYFPYHRFMARGGARSDEEVTVSLDFVFGWVIMISFSPSSFPP